MSLIVVGSVAFDTIETSYGRREKTVGGSATYCALAASFFTNPKIVAVVGEDFPSETLQFLKSRGIDTRGVQLKSGKTFHWEGKYGEDPNKRTTLKLELNVFKNFKPQLHPEYRKQEIIFLGNIDPDLQLDIVSQVEKPKLIAMDTIDHWIQNKPQSLLEVMEKVDVFFANDEEVKMLAQEKNLVKAGRKLVEKGPSLMVIKKGEHGALLLGRDFVFGILAHPCEEVIDPTGAGDCFAGGFLGYLDKIQSYEWKNIREAAVFGSVQASYAIEDFGINRFKNLSFSQITQRFKEFRHMVSF
ncbi:sugar kinase [bacterium]|nr:sugar kinase [bacterium]